MLCMGFPVYRRKVRFWDVDAYGHLFNARYLVYFDDVLCDAFDAAGVSFLAEENGGYEFVVALLECDFVGDAWMGQELDRRVRAYVDRLLHRDHRRRNR